MLRSCNWKGIMVIVVIAFLVVPAMTAQATPDTTRVNKRVAHLEEQLDLTAEQTAQIREILLQPREEGRPPGADRKHGGKNKVQKESVDSRIAAVLNNEQKVKYAKIQHAPPPPRRGDRPRMLIERLQFDKTQAARLQKITAAMQEERQRLRVKMRDGSGDREQMRAAMRSISEAMDSRIEEILTETQKQEYEKIKEERRQQRPRDRRGRGHGPRGRGDDG